MTELSDDQKVEITRQLREKGVAEDQIEVHIAAILSGQGEPCGSCGDAQPQPPFAGKPPYYILMGEALHRQECERIIALARERGWSRGVEVDGKTPRNSSVMFTDDAGVLERMRQIAKHAGPLLGLDVWPHLLASVQLGRYRPPQESYGWHVDHDPTRRHVEHDRKLSLVGALSDGGALELSGIGRMNLNAGDMLAFGGNVSHMAPALDHERFTIVAWIPGPPWR